MLRTSSAVFALLLASSCMSFELTRNADSQWAVPGGMMVSITDPLQYRFSPLVDASERDRWTLQLQAARAVDASTKVDARETLIGFDGTFQGEPLGVFYCSQTVGKGRCYADTNNDQSFEFVCEGRAQVFSFAAGAAATFGGPAPYQNPPIPRRFASAPEYVTGCAAVSPIAYSPAQALLTGQSVEVVLSAAPDGQIIGRAITGFSDGTTGDIATASAPAESGAPSQLVLLGATFQVWSEQGAPRGRLVNIDSTTVFSENQGTPGNPR